MPTTTPTDILIIDDHRLFNDGLKLLLSEQPEFNVCGQVFQPGDALPAISRLNPNLIILDINLQGENGIDIGKKIMAGFPHIKVIILTMYNQPKLIDETRKTGLHGYLLKDSSTAELLTGIRSVLSGRLAFDTYSNTQLPALFDTYTDDLARRLNLTFREMEIIRLVKDGMSNDRIAERLNISSFTVKTHRKNIHFKLNITNVAELIQFALKHGI